MQGIFDDAFDETSSTESPLFKRIADEVNADGYEYYLDKYGIEYYQDVTDGGWYSDDGRVLDPVPARAY